MTLVVEPDYASDSTITPTTERALYWSGVAPAQRTLLDILGDTAARHPGAPAIDDGSAVLT